MVGFGLGFTVGVGFRAGGGSAGGFVGIRASSLGVGCLLFLWFLVVGLRM